MINIFFFKYLNDKMDIIKIIYNKYFKSDKYFKIIIDIKVLLKYLKIIINI